MLPPVSVPRVKWPMPAATAAADPPLDPPGTLDRSHGLRLTPHAEFSVEEPIANSSQLVLPSSTAPPDFSLAGTVPSNGGTNVFRWREPQVVGSPFVMS